MDHAAADRPGAGQGAEERRTAFGRRIDCAPSGERDPRPRPATGRGRGVPDPGDWPGYRRSPAA